MCHGSGLDVGDPLLAKKLRCAKNCCTSSPPMVVLTGKPRCTVSLPIWLFQSPPILKRSCGSVLIKPAGLSKNSRRSARSLWMGAYTDIQWYSMSWWFVIRLKIRGPHVKNFRPSVSQFIRVGQSSKKPTLYHWIRANFSMYTTWGLQLSVSLQSSSQKCSSESMVMFHLRSLAVWISAWSLWAWAISRQFKPCVLRQTILLSKVACREVRCKRRIRPIHRPHLENCVRISVSPERCINWSATRILLSSEENTLSTAPCLNKLTSLTCCNFDIIDMNWAALPVIEVSSDEFRLLPLMKKT